MSILRHELGTLTVDAGDVVCFSVDAVLRMMKKLGHKDHEGFDTFVEKYNGICCCFGADGIYGVDQVTIVQGKDEYQGILIGGPDGDVTIKEKASG